MCGIIGYFNFKDSYRETIDSMKKIYYRGRDCCGIFNGQDIQTEEDVSMLKVNKVSNFAMGHLLHSIVDFVPQPLKEKGVLVCNCEVYNWQSLAEKYHYNVKSDSQLLLKLLDEFGMQILDELDGPYAFAYLKNEKLYLVRDRLGIKPLFYFYENDRFAFASEKKVLPVDAVELDPRKILIYDLKSKNVSFKKRYFFKLGNALEEDYNQIKEEVKTRLINAIKKRIPENQKIGILFSGGIDSTVIAYLLKKMHVDFTCYTAKVKGGNIEEASDLIYAREIAEKYNLDLKIAEISTENLKPVVKEVVELIEDRDYIKVSVALPLYLACQEAKKDKVKVIFSGLGSEEIFAGYLRHKKTNDVNKECLEGLKILHIRDLYRDDLVTMKNNIELRVPFLDNDLIKYCLDIPDKYKLSSDKIRSKIVLRDVAYDLGLDKKYAERQKKAAQYGSKFDKGLLRLAKDANLGKQEYINKLDVKNVL